MTDVCADIWNNRAAFSDKESLEDFAEEKITRIYYKLRAKPTLRRAFQRGIAPLEDWMDLPVEDEPVEIEVLNQLKFLIPTLPASHSGLVCLVLNNYTLQQIAGIQNTTVWKVEHRLRQSIFWLKAKWMQLPADVVRPRRHLPEPTSWIQRLAKPFPHGDEWAYMTV